MTGPFIGDIRVAKKYPPDTPLAEIAEFEIWDGQRWVDAQAEFNREIVVDLISKRVTETRYG